MGKRQPFACPYPGCDKTGKVSGIKQHFRDKHGDDIPESRLEFLITNGEKIMNYNENLVNRLSDLPKITWRRGFWAGLGVGAALGIITTVAIGAGVIGSCQGGAEICPASISRLVNTP